MDRSPDRVNELAEKARTAKPSVLRSQTYDRHPEVRKAAADELARRDEEMSKQGSLTGVVEPL